MTIPPSTAPGRNSRPLVVDAEHFSVRFLVPVLTIALVIVFHFAALRVLSALLGAGVNPLCLVLPLDALVLWAGGYAVERGLKRVLPSRRSATLSDDALVLVDGRRQPPKVTRIEWHRTVNVAAWRFAVSRRTRVPKGWYCMALRLLQDEDEAIVYSFMAPKEAESAVGYSQFVRLRPRQETQANTDLSAVAEQRRLLKLEDARWQDGAEISREDFHALLAALQRHLRTWS